MLSDDPALNLTVAATADRARTPLGDAVAPDAVLADPDETVRRAAAWLGARR